MAAIARGIHQAYQRFPDLMPRFLQDRIYSTMPQSQEIISSIREDLARNNSARSHLLAPLKMISVVALEALTFLVAIVYIPCALCRDLYRGHRRFENILNDLPTLALILVNPVFVVGAGSVAALAAIVVPSTLKVFKSDANLIDDVVNARNPAPDIQNVDERIEGEVPDILAQERARNQDLPQAPPQVPAAEQQAQRDAVA